MNIFKWIASLFSSPSVEEVVAPAPAPKPAVKAEKPVAKITKAALNKLTKAQLEEKGREFGIEVDRRKKKDAIVAEVLKATKK